MTQSLDNAFQLIWSYLPVLIAAIAVLVIGWVVALAVSNLTRKALQRTKLDEKLANWIMGEEKAEGVDTGLWISKGIYYIIMLFVLVGFFQVLGITLITEPLNRFLNEVFEFAPRLFSVALLLLIAWIVGNVLRAILLRILNAAKIDERFGRSVGFEKEKQVPITKTLADAIYYLIFLLFLPAILNALALQGLLQPVNSM
jgi:NADH:ubiquinone oxidoreductase subunit 3 (subunit A)